MVPLDEGPDNQRLVEARISMLRGEFEVEQEVLRRSITESTLLDEELLQDRGQMVRSRDADAAAYRKGPSDPAARKRGNGHV